MINNEVHVERISRRRFLRRGLVRGCLNVLAAHDGPEKAKDTNISIFIGTHAAIFELA